MIVCVLSAHLRDDESSTCVCLRLREQCLRSEITSVSRVAHVLLLRFVAGNTDANTLASKRSQLIGNTAIVRKRCVIHNKSTCVCLRLSVVAFTRKRRDARFDLWPALGQPAIFWEQFNWTSDTRNKHVTEYAQIDFLLTRTVTTRSMHTSVLRRYRLRTSRRQKSAQCSARTDPPSRQVLANAIPMAMCSKQCNF